ncbi:MAG: LysM peptidoglycan-binding domain-containing protein [Cytophagales bacterium]|nr:LysM peptidoglycan-binding domain-containing protein [Cytophagales bacterium]
MHHINLSREEEELLRRRGNAAGGSKNLHAQDKTFKPYAGFYGEPAPEYANRCGTVQKPDPESVAKSIKYLYPAAKNNDPAAKGRIREHLLALIAYPETRDEMWVAYAELCKSESACSCGKDYEEDMRRIGLQVFLYAQEAYGETVHAADRIPEGSLVYLKESINGYSGQNSGMQAQPNALGLDASEINKMTDRFLYKVESGESPLEVCERLGISLAQLKEANGWAAVDLQSGKIRKKAKSPAKSWHPGEYIILPEAFELGFFSDLWILEDGKAVCKPLRFSYGEHLSDADILGLVYNVSGWMEADYLGNFDVILAALADTLGKNKAHWERFDQYFRQENKLTRSFEEYMINSLSVILSKNRMKEGRVNFPLSENDKDIIKKRNRLSAFFQIPETPESLKVRAAQKERDAFRKNDMSQMLEKPELWYGTVEELAEEAQQFLDRAMKRNADFSFDTYPMFRILFSLGLQEQNIQAFLRPFGGKKSFIEKLKATKREVKEDRSSMTSQYTRTAGLGSGGLVYNSQPKFSVLFSEEDLRAAEQYLTPAKITSNRLLEDRSSEYDRFVTDGKLNFGQFEEGTFISMQKGSEVEYYYIVRKGDNPSMLARKMNTSLETLNKLNGWGNSPMIWAGQGIRVPQKPVMSAEEHFSLQNGRIYRRSREKVSLPDTCIIRGSAFNPAAVERQIIQAFGRKDGLAKDKGELIVNVYLRGKLALVFFLETGADLRAMAQVDDDRSLVVYGNIKIYASAGLRIKGYLDAAVRKNLASLGTGEVHESVKSFAVKFNHRITEIMLEKEAFAPEHIGYWDDKERREMLAHNYSEFELLPSDLIKVNDKERFRMYEKTYTEISGTEKVGDRFRKRETEQSDDFLKKQGEDSNFAAEVYLMDTDRLDLIYSHVGLDRNLDNQGQYLTAVLSLSVKDLIKLVKDGAELLNDAKKIKEFFLGGGLSAADQLGILKELGIAAALSTFAGKLAEAKTAKDSLKLVNQDHPGWFDQITLDVLPSVKEGKPFDADLGLRLTAHFVLDKNSWRMQYFNVHDYIEAKAQREQRLFSYARLLELSAGFQLEASYEKMLHETPGTETLTYISTIYNALRYRSDDKKTRDERADLMKLAQARRRELVAEGKEMSKAEEQEWLILDKYWAQQSRTFESKAWAVYREKHNDTLNEIATKFFSPIFEAEDKFKWTQKMLMTISVSDMKNRAGFKNPKEMIEKFKLITDSMRKSVKKEMQSTSLKEGTPEYKKEYDKRLYAEALKEANFTHLEKYILFALYKNHQKHAYDYYNYTSKELNDQEKELLAQAKENKLI